MMRRLTDADYSIDAVTAAKALLGAWLCRRLDDGMVMRRRITETEAYCGASGSRATGRGRSSPPRRALASPTPPRATSAANGGLRLSNNYGFFKKFLGALAA